MQSRALWKDLDEQCSRYGTSQVQVTRVCASNSIAFNCMESHKIPRKEMNEGRATLKHLFLMCFLFETPENFVSFAHRTSGLCRTEFLSP